MVSDTCVDCRAVLVGSEGKINFVDFSDTVLASDVDIVDVRIVSIVSAGKIVCCTALCNRPNVEDVIGCTNISSDAAVEENVLFFNDVDKASVVKGVDCKVIGMGSDIDGNIIGCADTDMASDVEDNDADRTDVGRLSDINGNVFARSVGVAVDTVGNMFDSLDVSIVSDTENNGFESIGFGIACNTADEMFGCIASDCVSRKVFVTVSEIEETFASCKDLDSKFGGDVIAGKKFVLDSGIKCNGVFSVYFVTISDLEANVCCTDVIAAAADNDNAICCTSSDVTCGVEDSSCTFVGIISDTEDMSVGCEGIRMTSEVENNIFESTDIRSAAADEDVVVCKYVCVPAFIGVKATGIANAGKATNLEGINVGCKNVFMDVGKASDNTDTPTGCRYFSVSDDADNVVDCGDIGVTCVVEDITIAWADFCCLGIGVSSDADNIIDCTNTGLAWDFKDAVDFPTI